MGPGVFGDGESRELVEVDHGWLLISKSLISKKKLIMAKNNGIYDKVYVFRGFRGRRIDWDGRGGPRVASYQYFLISELLIRV